jgi:3-hydroxyisobutyrate dehydrogenase-like beta-hydroxyacid dehydrogenase
VSETVGIIGLGVLGSAIVPNLIKSGYSAVGYDIERAKAEELVDEGMTVAGSIHDVAAQAQVVITCLPTIESLHEVVSGAGGLATLERPGQIVVEISTLPVAEKERARDALAAVGKTMVDCSVSGNRIVALRKGLTAFASGEPTACERIEPVLLGFCQKTTYVGPFGCGMKMKLVGNLLNLVHNCAAAEAMVISMKSGLDPKLIHEAISGSGSSSAMFEVRGALMATNDYRKGELNFSVPLKDARIIAEQAASVLCPLPLYQGRAAAVLRGGGAGALRRGPAAVCAAMERAANCERT